MRLKRMPAPEMMEPVRSQKMHHPFVGAALAVTSTALLLFPPGAKATVGNPDSFRLPENSQPQLANLSPETKPPVASVSGKLSPEAASTVTLTATNDTSSVPQGTRLAGTYLPIERLGRSFRDCPRDLAYQVEERTVKSDAGVSDVTTLVCDSVRFVFKLDRKNMSVDVAISFPKGRDKDPDAPGAGIGRFSKTDMRAFPDVVRSLPQGAQWAGLKVFAEQKPVWNYATRVYALPVDSKGKAVTALGNGQYIVLKCMCMYGHTMYVFPIVITEPDGKYSIPVSGGKK